MNFDTPEDKLLAPPALRVAVALYEGFSLMELACILDPLSHFREVCPDRPLAVDLYSLNGAPVRARGGVTVPTDSDLNLLERHCRLLSRPDYVFVLSGPVQDRSKGNHIQSLARMIRTTSCQLVLCGEAAAQGVALGQLSSGSAAAVHWRDMNRLRELRPASLPDSVLFDLSGQIGTCAGETAAMDCMLSILSRLDEGATRRVCHQLLLSGVRLGQASQPGAQEQKFGHLPAGVKRVADYMSRHLETPEPLHVISEEVALSQRQIERLFRRYLNETPGRFYLLLRLERALDLLQAEDLTLFDVALACGFNSVSALTRQLRKVYGKSARELRPTLSARRRR